MFYLNGNYVKEEDAKISILDLAILRGYGVFDYLRTYQGRPFHLQEHLLRFKYSAEHIGLSLPQTLEEIEQIVHTVQKLNNLSEASIKLVLTGGVSPDQWTPRTPTLIVFAYPLTSYPASCYEKGISVVTTRLSRSLPTSKTIQYTPGIVALQNKDAKEALYLNANNEILEATTSNFFAFKNGVLHTCCSDEVLIGITREVILRLSDFPLSTQAIRYDEISSLEEAFITASNKEVMPVTRIDSHPIGTGAVGPKTKHLMELFRAYTQSLHWQPLEILRYTAPF